MKIIVSLCLALIALVFAPNTWAQATLPSSAKSFSVVGTASTTNSGVTKASAIIPVGNGSAAVEFLQFVTDQTNGGVQFSIPLQTNSVVFTATNVASTIIQAVGTNFAANDIAILRFAPNTINESYQRIVVSAVTATNITFTTATTVATAVGDVVYRMVTNAWVVAGGFPAAAPAGGQVNTATNYFYNAGAGSVFNGPQYRPVLVEAVANTNSQLYNVSGRYR